MVGVNLILSTFIISLLDNHKSITNTVTKA